MAKTLCEWTRKEIERKTDRLAELLAKPRYFCRKCARAASEKRVLCSPVPLTALAAGNAMAEGGGA